MDPVHPGLIDDLENGHYFASADLSRRRDAQLQLHPAQVSAPFPPSLKRNTHMHVFVTGGTGHSGPYIIRDLIAAGHEVTALVRSDKAAEQVAALGAKARRGNLEDLDGLKDAAAASDGLSTSRIGRI